MRVDNGIRFMATNLTAGGNSNASRPVVVQVAQFVAQPLQDIRGQVGLVVYHNVMRGRDAALPDRLRHQEVIEMIPAGDGVIENGAGVRVFQILAIHLG